MLSAQQYVSTPSCPETVRNDSLPKKVLGVIDAAVFAAGKVDHIQRGNAEHFARAFAVACGDDRRVDPDVAVVVEVAVDRLRETVANARDSAERVGAHAQMRDVAQVFKSVAFGCDGIRVRIIDPADDGERRRLDFVGLSLALAFDKLAGGDDGTAGGQLGDFGFVVGEISGGDDLKRVEARAVGDGDEGEPGLGIAAGAHPAGNGDGRADGSFPGED